ncbi:hypothetical protein HED60_06645 [Planctomycetales bacterium ZRK34]|nr:hypothetical protein HED60_06645 [Planctomycetales bacterium ZRK34]
MAIEARVNPTWAWKWVIMAGFCLGFGALCIYDGLIAYPNHNQKVAAFAHYQPDAAEKLFDISGQPAGWSFDETKLDYTGHADFPAFADAMGWSDENPGPPKSDTDITTQWIMLVICALIGASALIWVFLHKGTKLIADENGFIASDGTRIGYAEITDINKAKWDSKGIAVVHYKTPEGADATAKIDDWVYRDGDLVLEQVEQMTGIGAISRD